MYQQSKVRHRPEPRKRCQKDGRETVREILARNVASISMGIVGCFCVTIPIAFKVAGTAYWPFVVAYGGCLVGIAFSGMVER